MPAFAMEYPGTPLIACRAAIEEMLMMLPRPASARVGEIDYDIVVLSTGGFLDKRLLQQCPIDAYNISTIEHLNLPGLWIFGRVRRLKRYASDILDVFGVFGGHHLGAAVPIDLQPLRSRHTDAIEEAKT